MFEPSQSDENANDPHVELWESGTRDATGFLHSLVGEKVTADA